MSDVSRREALRTFGSFALGATTVIPPFAAILTKLEKEGVINPDPKTALLWRTAAVGTSLVAAQLCSKYIPLAWQILQDKTRRTRIERDIEKSILEMRNTYDISVEFDVEGLPKMLEALFVPVFAKEILWPSIRREALKDLRDDLSIYPAELIKKYITHIHIVDDLEKGENSERMSIGGHAIGLGLIQVSISTTNQTLAATRAFEGRILNPAVVHHELAHYITQRISEHEWKATFPECTYADTRTLDNEELWREIPHFAIIYGTHDFREDIATIAESMLTKNSTMWERIHTDDILLRKVNYIKKWYARETKGMNVEMNEKFWFDYQKKLRT